MKRKIKCTFDNNDYYSNCNCDHCLYHKKMAQLFAETYNKGISLTKIGKVYGCSRVIIRNRLLMFGYFKNEKGKWERRK